MSFLAEDVSALSNKLPFCIHERHIAFTICGIADHHWIAYAFSNTYYDGYKDLNEPEFDCNCIDLDEIMAYSARAPDENLNIWSPMEYYLVVVS